MSQESLHPKPPSLIHVAQSDLVSRLSGLEGQSHLVLQVNESLEIPTAQQIAAFGFEVGIVTNLNGTHVIPGTKHGFRTHAMLELGLGNPDGLIHNHPSGRRLPSGTDLMEDRPYVNQYVMTPDGFSQYRLNDELLFQLLLEQFLNSAPPDLQMDVLDKVDIAGLHRRMENRYKKRGVDTTSDEYIQHLKNLEMLEREDTFREWYQTLSNSERNSYLDPLLESRPDMVQTYSWDNTEEAKVMLSGGDLFD